MLVECEICGMTFTYLEEGSTFNMAEGEGNEFHFRHLLCPDFDCKSHIVIRVEMDWSKVNFQEMRKNTNNMQKQESNNKEENPKNDYNASIVQNQHTKEGQ